MTVTDPLMAARRVGLLALLTTAACVETNPRWDAPDNGDGESTLGSDDDVADDATSDGSTDGDDASSGEVEADGQGHCGCSPGATASAMTAARVRPSSGSTRRKAPPGREVE